MVKYYQPICGAYHLQQKLVNYSIEGNMDMGTWGTAIYSDDTASDIKDDFKEYVADGLTSEEATERLKKEYNPDPDDDEWSVFWLSLALIQWQTGRLLQDVKEKAIEIIDNGSDLMRWLDADKNTQKKRVQALNMLKEQLNMPQPPIKKIPKRFQSFCEFDVGDAISYKLQSGNYIILKVIKIITDKGGSHPVFEVCDWIGSELPIEREINKLKPMEKSKCNGILCIGQVNKKEYPKERITLVAKNTKTYKTQISNYPVTLWRQADDVLKSYFGFC